MSVFIGMYLARVLQLRYSIAIWLKHHHNNNNIVHPPGGHWGVGDGRGGAGIWPAPPLGAFPIRLNNPPPLPPSNRRAGGMLPRSRSSDISMMSFHPLLLSSLAFYSRRVCVRVVSHHIDGGGRCRDRVFVRALRRLAARASSMDRMRRLASPMWWGVCSIGRACLSVSLSACFFFFWNFFRKIK
jgi:hypothetical protein